MRTQQRFRPEGWRDTHHQDCATLVSQSEDAQCTCHLSHADDCAYHIDPARCDCKMPKLDPISTERITVVADEGTRPTEAVDEGTRLPWPTPVDIEVQPQLSPPPEPSAESPDQAMPSTLLPCAPYPGKPIGPRVHVMMDDR